MSWCFDDEMRDKVNEQTMFAFFKILHINLNVAIEKRENFNTTNLDAISVQNIDFFDVAIDEIIDEIENAFFECLRTIFDAKIERNKSFDDAKNDEIIDWNDETESENIVDFCKTNFDFFACRVRICSWSLMLLSNLLLQRLHVYLSARFFAIRISFCCFNNFFAFCFILLFIFNSCFRKW